MIFGTFHQGSGLGNQLFRYVTTRALGEAKGYEWGMWQPELFKGKSFMKLDMGTPVEQDTEYTQWTEKKIVEDGVDIRGYDPEINFVRDWTCIDGEFQDEKYWDRAPLASWLTVEPLQMADDICVIGFRGGEYALYPELFLTTEYWQNAIEHMLFTYPGIHFEIHTDDSRLALDFFADLLPPQEIKVIHNIGINWRSVRYAKHLIIANSSFYILPSLLNTDVKEVIAPRYWARRNTKKWALPQNYYTDPRWKYI